LLTGNTRVAPTKKKSLPKFELCEAHLPFQLRQRANIKRNLTRIKGMVDTQEENEKKSPAELQCRLGILELYFKQALSVGD